eukprot:TRINITY_DN7712_c0_g1_i2.p1 TRINITY_DN7712_c0_g1~~TRINITY_DN7712_c0_g1_i2.p1  ORF type:complete len:180 (-),score=32.90 TRINITY_DN7712_c0_g1_i2:68-607(-)
MGDRWIFGYGSLMWSPGFTYEDRSLAMLPHYRRSLCMYSFVARGNKEEPGLVLGLESVADDACVGIAFKVATNQFASINEELHQRENTPLICYEATIKQIQLIKPGQEKWVDALVFVPIPGHSQFAGHLSQDEKIKILKTSKGERGTSLEYLSSTLHLLDAELGEKDEHLLELLRLAQI